MNRRGFLGAILAAAAAPAIVRADSLMRIIPRDAGILLENYTQVFDKIQVVSGIPDDFSAMISRVLRERAPEIARNIQQRNALLRKLQARHE